MRIISGPTGSGKTDVALTYVREQNRDKQTQVELVNADSFQFYREIPILTNQPKLDSLPAKMHLLATRSIIDPWNAGDFGRWALENRELVGTSVMVGTGLYVGAAIFGLDPVGVKGTPFQGEARFPYKMVVLNPDRADLYDRLNSRVDQMLASGGVEEAKAIWNLRESGGIPAHNPLLKTIGVKTMLQHFSGEIDFEEAIRLWKRDTRHLAKRQWTWLNKFCSPSDQILWLKPGADVAAQVRDFFA